MEAMGTDDRLPAAALIARLLARPHDFDLFQAIHILERAQPWARAVGTGDGTDEAVRFAGHVSLAFEPSDIRSVRSQKQKAGGDRATYTVSTAAMTLAGASGPLPLPFTEWLLMRRAARETAMSDFLDIFNHRFLSFLYRSRQKHAPGLNGRAPDEAALTACLDALGNLGLRAGERGPGGARRWLRHAGLLGGAPRSMSGLLAMLSDRLGVAVKGGQFVGGWRDLDARDSARVSGLGWTAARLNGRAVVGRRCWDQAAGIRIEFVDLPRAQFEALLPGGALHELTAWLVQSYLEQDLEVHVVLRPAPRAAACAVGGGSAVRLGWTSWLGARSAPNANPGTDAKAAVRAASSTPTPLAPARFTLRMPPSSAAWHSSNA
ncbi:type VI secretion system baseplate subunit TssG [Trinickia dinghuensis]|uniref:Type VI secretion system baseplate subunit TssG n=1 Tax=Trinickia dinghuensis TaxID=2291023 RepID=A0A3D8JTX2_9BURK|nr:type VI secretion system baseplate subunit TssG [Trinickia dinghuensis]RDU95841.1 type VI secretion system baseplate subunit TssG [Trinickia dinghuensis]